MFARTDGAWARKWSRILHIISQLHDHWFARVGLSPLLSPLSLVVHVAEAFEAAYCSVLHRRSCGLCRDGFDWWAIMRHDVRWWRYRYGVEMNTITRQLIMSRRRGEIEVGAGKGIEEVFKWRKVMFLKKRLFIKGERWISVQVVHNELHTKSKSLTCANAILGLPPFAAICSHLMQTLNLPRYAAYGIASRVMRFPSSNKIFVAPNSISTSFSVERYTVQL